MKPIMTIFSLMIVLASTSAEAIENDEEISQLLNDPSKRDLIFAQIAADENLAQAMLEKLAKTAEGDEAMSHSFAMIIAQYGQLKSSILEEAKKPAEAKGERQIIVKFKADANMTEVSKMESEIGLAEVKKIAPLNLKVYDIISSKSVQEAISACEKSSFVQYAEPNMSVNTKKN